MNPPQVNLIKSLIDRTARLPTDKSCPPLHFKWTSSRKRQGKSLNSNLLCLSKNDNTRGWLDVHITQPDILLGIPRSARCVQKLDDSLNSAIHTNFHTLLCSSSMWEPRDPLLKVVLLSAPNQQATCQTRTCVCVPLQTSVCVFLVM